MLKEIQKDLKYRKEVLAPKIAKEYKAAIDDGDGAHDNPGIRDKGQEMEDNLKEIQRLEYLLQTFPEKASGSDNTIVLGSEVLIVDLTTNQERNVKLVNEDTIEYAENGVSVESPLGKVLLNKKQGDEVEFETPSGLVRKYKILQIIN